MSEPREVRESRWRSQHRWDGPLVSLEMCDVPSCSRGGADASEQRPCMEDAMSHKQLEAMRIAYGFLWLFQGNSETDPNAKLAHEARKLLRDHLTQGDLQAGIIRAKALALAANWQVPTETWM